MSRRGELIDPEAATAFLRGLHELIGSPSYSGHAAMRRLNDARPVIGAMLDLTDERPLTTGDLLWAGVELHKRAETLKGGGL